MNWKINNKACGGIDIESSSQVVCRTSHEDYTSIIDERYTAGILAAAPTMLQILSEIYEDDKCGGKCNSIPHGILMDIREVLHSINGTYPVR